MSSRALQIAAIAITFAAGAPGTAFAAACGGGAVLYDAAQDGGDGIGGTGQSGGDGIGGTGRAAGDGLGGTGLFGTITRLGTLCIGGQPVAYGPATTVTVGGLPASADSLMLGQVAWVAVPDRPDSADAAEAKRIDVFIAAYGPVAEIDRQGRRLRMGSRWIRVLDDAILAGGGAAPLVFEAIEPGHVLAVSALPAGGRGLFATRIDSLPEGSAMRVVARGIPDLRVLARRDQVGRLRVEGFLGATAGLTIELAAMSWLLPEAARQRLVPDMRVWMSGLPTPAGARVLQITVPPRRIAPPAPPLFQLVPDVLRAPRVPGAAPGEPGRRPARDREPDRSPGPTQVPGPSPVRPDADRRDVTPRGVAPRP